MGTYGYAAPEYMATGTLRKHSLFYNLNSQIAVDKGLGYFLLLRTFIRQE